MIVLFFFSPNSHDDTLYPPDPDTVGRRWGLDTSVLTKTPIALYLGGNPVLFGVSTGALPEGAECEAHFGVSLKTIESPVCFRLFPNFQMLFNQVLVLRGRISVYPLSRQ